jgi:hypothetical protein
MQVSIKEKRTACTFLCAVLISCKAPNPDHIHFLGTSTSQVGSRELSAKMGDK